eukprot:s88_g41.t1
MWALLPKLPTKVGLLAGVHRKSGVPPEAPASNPQRGDDLFPIYIPAVVSHLLDKGPVVADAVAAMVNSLNYLALYAGGLPVPESFPERDLTGAQRSAVDHLCDVLEHLEEAQVRCPPMEESVKELVAARFDYVGDPVVPLEDLEADKVIAAWPKVGEAAIQDAVDFLPPHLQQKLKDPRTCLKQIHEWPDRPPASRVRASPEEWEKIVHAAHLRGMMVPVHPDDVFKDASGVPVLNGAGAVPKLKTVGGETKRYQRFISNLIPSNFYQDRIEGDDKLLPYLGQLTLLQQDESEVWVVDAEDFTSCFNLFRIPPQWHSYMAFGQLVDHKVFGGPAGQKVYPAMSVLPMGWVSSVAVIQAIVRSLVFSEAKIPLASEVAKTRELPEGDDLTVIYLDSYDQLRRLDEGCAEILKGQASTRHQAFLEVCEKKGLPLNAAKRLVASTQGTLQGGELDGKKGRYGLSREKMASLLGLGSAMMGRAQWSEFLLRHFVGKATFGMCFRRPLFAIFQGVFDEIQRRQAAGGMGKPPAEVVDEIVLVMTLVPMMVTNLRAPIYEEVAVTDASPSGGGAAVATKFRQEDCKLTVDDAKCYECGEELKDNCRFPCPADCGGVFCSLACVWGHRDIDHSPRKECPRRVWRPPRFGERFAGKRAPLSHAVAMQGHIEVQAPFDLHFGNDMFSDEGRAELNRLCADEFLEAEHWAPECKLFSRARGVPIRLESGRTIPGPQPVRDSRHIMGYPWLPSHQKAKVRQANNMVLKSLKRGEEARGKRYWTMEHPWRSWAWEFHLAKALEEYPEYITAIGSHCCFGGPREKWFAFFGNLPTLQDYLQKECRGHPNLQGYGVTERADGSLNFATEEEAEYPWQLCVAYAQALRRQFDLDGTFESMVLQEREKFYLSEMLSATSRLATSYVASAISAILARTEQQMVPGQEKAHLRQLLLAATYRGTDVRFLVDLGSEEAPDLHEIPYLAMRWEWRTVLAIPWKQPGHINELELNTVAIFLKRRARNRLTQHTRFFLVLDSMVTRGCLAKGRSSSPASMKRPKRSLRFAGLHPRTLRAYRLAIDRFLKFVRKRKLRIDKPRQLDRQISEFIDVSYQEGEPISYSGHLLSAVKRFHPHLRFKLVESSQFFRNWQRNYVPHRAVPASWPLVEALMGRAFRAQQPLFALLLGLGYNCLLRTTEILGLTHNHVMFHPNNRGLSVILPGSKTSQGNPQVLLVSDTQLVQLARRYIKPESTRLLWRQGSYQFRQLFARLLQELGFSPDDYTPYCLRRGGATWFFQTSLSMDAVVARGRWACNKTAKQYVDEGTMQLAHVSWSSRQRQAVKQGRAL